MTAESSTKLISASEIRTREICTALILSKITKGFHRELGMTPSQYGQSFEDAVEGAVRIVDSSADALVGLVEERVPFARQLELLGIALEPGIFYRVIHKPEKKPYAVQLTALSTNEDPLLGSNSYQEAVGRLPGYLRPATPFEGISVNLTEVFSRTFVSLPGGEYGRAGILTGGSRRFNTLCLDQYFGKPRVSQVRFDSLDRLVGMLVAHA